MKTWKIALILLVLALLAVIPAYAQEATQAPAPTEQVTQEAQPIAGVVIAAPTETQAPGLVAGVLLIGLGAAATVGGIALLRENYRKSAGN